MKKLVYLFLIFVFAIFLLPNSLASVYADDFIEINQASDLVRLRAQPDLSYRLTNDIDLQGADWTPISNFTGILDGDGHTISNFNISQTDGNVGFFENTNAAQIHDLQLLGVNISINSSTDTAISKVGALVANSQNSSFQNISVQSTVTISSPSLVYAGGILGHAQSGTRLNNCASTTSFSVMESGSSKTKYIGGAVGYFDNSQSYNLIVKLASQSEGNNLCFGGAYGIVCGAKSEIKNVVVSCDSASPEILGLIGEIVYPGDTVYANSIDYLYTTIQGDCIGNQSELEQAYSEGNITYDVANANIEVVDSRQPYLLSFYTSYPFDGRHSWDFGSIWQIGDNNSLPTLQHFSTFSFTLDEDRSFSSIMQRPNVDVITFVTSQSSFLYGGDIMVGGFVNTNSLMNKFFEIVGLRKDNTAIFSNDDVLNIINDPEVITEQSEDVTTYTLGQHVVTATQGTVNNNAGTWYSLDNSRILWGVYTTQNGTVSVYQILNCTAADAGVYSFVVNSIDYDIVISTEDITHGSVRRSSAVASIENEMIEDKISYGETLGYIAKASSDFGFAGWKTSLSEENYVSNTETLSIAFNENLFTQDGIFSSVELDVNQPINVFATFTKQVCDITFSFAINDNMTQDNISSIYINGMLIEPNEDGTITYKQAMNSTIAVEVVLPADYEFGSWYRPDGGTLSNELSFSLSVGEEESMQVVANFSKDTNPVSGLGYIWWIIGGSVAGIAIIGLVVFLIVKKRKDNSYKNMWY